MKCLVFNVKADYGHFKKFYTTSSPLTFSLPPRTAVAGMIGAIIGLDKNSYIQKFSKDDAQIALQIMKPVNKCRVSYNLINTKGKKDYSKITGRTQVTFELLKNPYYKIYFNHKEKEIYDKLKYNLENKKNHYTVSMGLSEFISEVEYVGEIELEKVDADEFVYIDTAIRFDEKLKVKFEGEKEYFKDTVPNEMNENREVTDYAKIFFERNGKRINCKTSYFIGSGGEHIVFL